MLQSDPTLADFNHLMAVPYPEGDGIEVGIQIHQKLSYAPLFTQPLRLSKVFRKIGSYSIVWSPFSHTAILPYNRTSVKIDSLWYLLPDFGVKMTP
jgi:hypothetical protein